VVGASGDLAKKKTYPALLALYRAGLLPVNTVIWGFARSPKTTQDFRQHIAASLEDDDDDEEEDNHDKSSFVSNDKKNRKKEAFLQACYYRNGTSYGDADCLASILQEASPRLNVLVYLAVPPHVFGETTAALQMARRTLESGGSAGAGRGSHSSTTNFDKGWFRVVLEKPFGRDLATCETLLQELQAQKWPERDLYRIDHYLGKEMVQNLTTLRQHNPWLGALWNKSVVQSVHILFKEPFGTEGRGGYFDNIGIIRDILQNHLLQVLTLVAMELPKGEWTADSIRDEKVKVMQSMSTLEVDDCLLGQYEGYRNDKTIVDKTTVCPTYAAIHCRLDKSPTWQGIPFVLEAGKALDERLCEVRLHLHGSRSSPPNALVMRLQPTPAVYFAANVKTPGFSSTPISSHWGVTYEQHLQDIPEAYSRLLLDVLRGHQENFVRDDELRRAWEIFTPLLHRLEEEKIAPLPYERGEEGPANRQDFLRTMGIAQPVLPLASAL
jgi:glucose-6-phosphate 1-dehydrogenase